MEERIMRDGPIRVALCVGLIIGLASAASAQRDAEDPEREEYIRSHYTKFEHRIPMRDGAELFTSVYVPNNTSEPYPILLVRTPYSVGPYGADQYKTKLGPTTEFERDGYIFVFQDVRGRFMSEGDFVNMRPHIPAKDGAKDFDESTDTYDTIDWLVKNLPGNNGRVGLWGVSYPGFYTSAGMINSHPALKAASPQAPIADWFFDDMHHHGAFTLSLSFGFFSVFGQAREGLVTEWPKRFDYGTPDGYQFFLDLGPLNNANEDHLHGEIAFWNEFIKHPDYDDFWQSRNILPHLEGITCAVMTVGGWFDAEDLYGPLHTYEAVEKSNPGISNTLVMGPWRHGGWIWTEGDSLAAADFGFKTSKTFQEEALLPFFRHHLKGEGEIDLPEAWVFETGANRWRDFPEWPPEKLTVERLYLRENGVLAFALPTTEQDAFDEYVSDPANPVPYTPEISTGWHSEYMAEDQRFAAWRPDVLVYRSEPLEEDLTLAGPLSADLWVSTTGGDADWVVKLIDEYPGRLPGWEKDSDETDLGGTQQMVRSEALRGRYRSSYSEPTPFTSGEITPLTIELQDVLHTFKRGHRIMIQIQSSLFPLLDRNPQSWVENIFEAEEEDFIKATHRIYRSADHPSSMAVGILN
jgi:putative CocE/NonD family hydrolase